MFYNYDSFQMINDSAKIVYLKVDCLGRSWGTIVYA